MISLDSTEKDEKRLTLFYEGYKTMVTNQKEKHRTQN